MSSFKMSFLPFALISASLLSVGGLVIPFFKDLSAIAYSTSTTENISEVSSKKSPTLLIAQSRQAFTVVYLYSGPDIKIKSSATGKVYGVKYTGAIGAEIGDTVTIIIRGDRWTTIINERTGRSAAITSVY